MRVPCRRIALLSVLMTAVIAPAAHADFTPFVLVSGSTAKEADSAADPVIAENGLVVAYAGSQSGVAGIYEKNLQTGALVTVVADPAAGEPSVSADGRYVSFTTTTDLATGTAGQCSSVYVADMSPPGGGAPTYTLASALDGTTTGLTYAGSAIAGCPGGGSAAAGRVALSADGSEVAFTVVGSSNLTTGAAGATTTPGAQVAVRNLTTDTTTLVSQTIGSLGGVAQPVPNGGAMTDTSTGAVGATAGAATANADPGDSTAAISADGTTVAWLGINIPAQAPAAADDAAQDFPQQYDEPLWRRIADGPTASTRRVTGLDDPAGPCPGGCVGPLDTQWSAPGSSGPGQDSGADKGTFQAWEDGFAPSTAGPSVFPRLQDATPQLSANGQVVAFLSTQPATGQDPQYPAGTPTPSLFSTNVYIANMTSGYTRVQALDRLTAWASNDFDDFSSAGALQSIALSPEGNRLAFVTRRTAFPFTPPALTTPQLSGAAFNQLYLADLSDGTLQLVTTGYDGQPANDPDISPSFSANDGPITFASGATNLVYGAFTQNPLLQAQVFSTTEVKPPATPGITSITAPPANPAITPEWQIGATARQQKNGSVLVYVRVPGAGKLRAAARAGVPASTATPASVKRGSTNPKQPKKKKKKKTSPPVPKVTTQTVASASSPSFGAGLVRLTLSPPSRYHSLITRVHGLYATVQIVFTSHTFPQLTEKLPIDFVIKAKAKAKTKPKTKTTEHTGGRSA